MQQSLILKVQQTFKHQISFWKANIATLCQMFIKSNQNFCGCFSKLSNNVKNDVVRKAVYDKLVIN